MINNDCLLRDNDVVVLSGIILAQDGGLIFGFPGQGGQLKVDGGIPERESCPTDRKTSMKATVPEEEGGVSFEGCDQT